MTKLEQLKKSVREWNETRSIALAFEICEFLAKNLGGEHEA